MFVTFESSEHSVVGTATSIQRLGEELTNGLQHGLAVWQDARISARTRGAIPHDVLPTVLCPVLLNCQEQEKNTTIMLCIGK
jgi:hypothetical protein